MKMYLRRTEIKVVNRNDMTHNRVKWRDFVNTVKKRLVPKQ